MLLIVGGGPGGVMLAYLMARQGVEVTLLEAQQDFDRNFRGDALIPAVMEILESMGLADRLLELTHSRIQKILVHTDDGSVQVSDYSTLPGRFNYMTVLPQSRFLEFMVEEARRFPNFRVVMGANARELLEEGGRVRGVRYQTAEGWHEERASLVVGADGRFSRLRHLAGFRPVGVAPPMDVLWFKLPKRGDEGRDLNLSVHVGRGYYVALIDRFDYWQVSLVIPKGTSRELKSQGTQRLRSMLRHCLPQFGDRIEALEWADVYVLQIQSSRLRRWYKPGLLFIGDAAHTMSSVGGVGINCAIQDAVVASNVLAAPLLNGGITERHLREVQWRQEIPIRLTQLLQTMAHKQVIERALDPSRSFRLPLALRIPFLQRLAVRFAAFGIWRVRVDQRRFFPAGRPV